MESFKKFLYIRKVRYSPILWATIRASTYKIRKLIEKEFTKKVDLFMGVSPVDQEHFYKIVRELLCY